MKRIAILVETSLASGRQILGGISRFLKERSDLSVFHLSGNLGEMNPDALVDWQGDGIIARVLNKSIAERLTATGLPCVDVLGNVQPQPFPLVKCDDIAIGRMVAEHFAGSGFRHFGMIGMSAVNWARDRESAFFETAKEYQGTCHRLDLRSTESEQVNLSTSMDAIRNWLPDLPKPIAILVASDQFAPLLFEAAHQLGLRIPEELSVIGVDNDAPYCDLCRPELSSVSPGHEKVGYLAAQLLEQILSGQPTGATTMQVSPEMIYLRRSSSSLAVQNQQLAKALEYIRRHAAEGPRIDEIAAHAGYSRSVLQRRFRSELNRTIGETILNEKLNIAKQLLLTSELSVNRIAEKAGFNCQEYMGLIFRKHLQQTPVQFRKS
ncbi:MAG: LacI family transcriptional regulator [Lentimonas sp.]|jgi:LacI family transcriptional regulator